MSFFLKGKPRNAPKRKPNKEYGKKAKQTKKHVNVDSGQESIDSEEEEELENVHVPEHSDSENELETPEDKKLRLAKKYLEEIAREEQKRAENKEYTDEAIAKRLQDDYLETQGKLHKKVADLVKPPSGDITVLRCKEHRLSLTQLCVSSDGAFIFTGSKCASIVKWSLKDLKKVGSLTYKIGLKEYPKVCHRRTISALAISSDGKYLASSDSSKFIEIWNPDTLIHVKTFKGHKTPVTGLVFRKDSHDLYSSSEDRSVKIWSLNEMSYVETMYGHQSNITAIDALSRERAITSGGRDSTIRIWKIVEESQLIFNGTEGTCIDDVKLIDEEHFVSCGDNGAISVWNVVRKKPLHTIEKAHGMLNNQARWITCVTALLNTDLIASGSHDGFIRLWKLEETKWKLIPLHEIPVPGFINDLQFGPDGKTLIAAVGQEHKMARWWKEVRFLSPLLSTYSSIFKGTIYSMSEQPKEDLPQRLQEIREVIKSPIDEKAIVSLCRKSANHHQKNVKPIVIKFSSQYHRDITINSTKSFNSKCKNMRDILSTSHLNIQGNVVPMYANENIHLHKQPGFCLLLVQRIFLKKGENTKTFRIRSEDTLTQIINYLESIPPVS